MSLSPGTRLGPYEVVCAIGVGGMGEVYRALDPRLGRDVALKILPDEFARDADRVTRFRREAQALAALNHPHIAIIHGLEEGNGKQALVMELVSGVTLAERLAVRERGLDLDEALAITRQIAQALEAAHDRGIIHRDLKPANIKVRDDGTVKVLDFGLAKTVDPLPAGDIADSPTATTPAMTGSGGLLLGTAAYMSPEQARGKPVDKRADIWAFGVVLYELLTGQRLFRGESPTDVIAQVLTAEPDWNALPKNTPPAIATLLQRCLTRDPSTRLRDIGEARICIENVIAHPERSRLDVPTAGRPPATTRVWPIAIAAVAGAAVAAFVLWPRPVAHVRPGVTRTTIPLPAEQTLSVPSTTSFALSADGRRLVYKARVGGVNRVYVREMHLAESRAIPDTDGTESFTLSPDGTWLVYSAARVVKKLPLAGGPAIQICGCQIQTGMLWSDDGFVYFAAYLDKKWTLRRVSESGGKTEALPGDPGSKQLTHPAALPGGRRLLVALSDPAGGAVLAPGIAAYDLESGALTPLITQGTAPSYLATGHLAFVKDSALYAVPFDAASLKVTGEPAPLIEHIGMGDHFQVADYAVADIGTIVYSVVPFTRTRIVKLGSGSAPEPVLPQAQGYLELDLSADGRHLAVTVDPRGVPMVPSVVPHIGVPYRGDLYTIDLALKDFTRRTTGAVRGPAFFPRDQRLAFGGGRRAEWAINFGDATYEAILTSKDRDPLRPSSFSPDGTRLAYDHNGNLYVLPLEGERTPLEFLSSRFEQLNPAFSPNGRWIAYDLSDGRGGPRDIWVRPYPQREPAVRISTGGGLEPRWSPDGKRIYFLNQGRIMVAQVSPGDPFRTSAPTAIAAPVTQIHSFAVAPDGVTFYAIVGETSATPPSREITVVTGWFDEVRTLASAPRR